MNYFLKYLRHYFIVKITLYNMLTMKVITWNVNGIRSRIFNGKTSAQIAKQSEILPEEGSPMYNMIKNYDPDFICLQETRCSVANGQKFKIPGYNSVFNQSDNVGAREANRYSGTCIFYKDTYGPIDVEYQFPGYADIEGRIISLHFSNFTIINVYTPNSGTNFANRLDWQRSALLYLNSIPHPVIYTGDMNVAWRDADVHFRVTDSPTYKSKVDDNIVGFLPEERNFVPELLRIGYTDAYINQQTNYPPFDGFTYWDTRSKKIEGLPGARFNKHGWRIDYHFVKGMQTLECCALYSIGTEYIKLGDCQCSDHCPVYGHFVIN